MFRRPLTLFAGTTSARATRPLISLHYVTAPNPMKAVMARQPTTPIASLTREFSTMPRRAANSATWRYPGKRRQREEERLQQERKREEERRRREEEDDDDIADLLVGLNRNHFTRDPWRWDLRVSDHGSDYGSGCDSGYEDTRNSHESSGDDSGFSGGSDD